MSDWGRRIVLDLRFDQVVALALYELQREGFELVGKVNVRDVLRRSLKADFRRYAILSVWHPALAREAFRHSVEIGVELPINAAIYELADGETGITVAEPFPSLSNDRPWREECLALLPIEQGLSDHLGAALERMSHQARTPAWRAQADNSAPDKLAT